MPDLLKNFQKKHGLSGYLDNPQSNVFANVYILLHVISDRSDIKMDFSTVQLN